MKERVKGGRGLDCKEGNYGRMRLFVVHPADIF